MQTNLADFIRNTPEGDEADAILRKCVHCGFCTATCPTYQLLGDELDGPRGRIYLIKQTLEGKPATERTQLHLDRCLTCRSCETTCPSGVHYSRLLDIGRHVVNRQVGRRMADRALRGAMRTVLPKPGRFTPLLELGMTVRSLMPKSLKAKLPQGIPDAGEWPEARHTRRMIVLEGCVQPALSPRTNAAAARVLDRIGISLVRVPRSGCCGAVTFHLDAEEHARDAMRRNIDAWWPQVESGAEAIVITASGCGVMVKDYGWQLARDPAYAAKAKRISEIALDISEVIMKEEAALVAALDTRRPAAGSRNVYHSPCTLQHGMKLQGRVEALLQRLGFELPPVQNAHLCCGSAGTYSITQPVISKQLLDNKIAALTRTSPQCILTSNVGCQSHLQGATDIPVRHWIEEIDTLLAAGA